MIERLIWLVPVVVAALGAWRPRAGLVALAAALPLFGSPPGGPYLGALDAAGLAAIVTAWRAGRPQPSALTWPAAAFVAVSLACLVPWTYSPPSWQPSILLGLVQALPGVESWSGLYGWRAAADLLLGWGIFLAVRRAFSGHSPRPLALGLLAGLAVTVVLGLVSYGGLLSLDAYRPDHYGLGAPWRRLASLFFLSGWLSEYLVVVGPLALLLAHLAGRWGQVIGLLLLAASTACLILTHQRGAWVAAAAQLLFWLALSFRSGGWGRSRLRRPAIAGVVALSLAAVVLVSVGTPVRPLLTRMSEIESGLTPRKIVWKVALEMAGERPVLGWGLGSYAPAYDVLHPPGPGGASLYRATAHNLYLHLLAERGVPGLFALALLAWAAATCLRRPRAGQEALAVILGVSLVGTAVYGLVQYMFHLRCIAWLLWLLVACVTLVSRQEKPTKARGLGRLLVVAVLLLIPVRALVVDAPRYAGDREYGFHAVEQSSVGPFEWTEAVAARRMPWAGETLVLSLANGHPRAAERPVNVVIGIDGKTAGQFEIAGGWEEHRLQLGPAQKEWIVLTLAARPTFRPFSDYLSDSELGRATDIRALGVAVRQIRWE